MLGLFGRYKVLLAPMAGVTDIAFRALCLEQGADLAFTEMVSAKGLSYANDKTRHLLDLGPEETEAAVQLFGHEAKTIADMAAWVEQELGDKLAFIDINMGCPARKIVTKGDGSALMKDPVLAASIVESVKRSVSHPVTCKIRRGWSAETGETAPEFAKALQESGADAITVHGRFSTQLYRGDACWDTIKRVKEELRIPVVGNGDIRSGSDVLQMIEETNCDAVMIARAAEGNPWIFAEAQSALSGERAQISRTPEDRISIAKRHLQMLYERKGHLGPMRKHAAWYISGMPGAAYARGKLNECNTVDDFMAVFDELLERQHAA